MKLVIVIILLGVLAVMGTQSYSFLGRERKVRGEFNELREKLERAQVDQDRFRAELDYYLNPVNLEKELRARFNYKKPGEKLLIIVPRSTSSYQLPATSSQQPATSN